MSSLATTNCILVTAKANFLKDYSNPGEKKYLYAYKIGVENHGDTSVQLLSRYWLIIDSESNRQVVRGAGVVGKQPEIKPGESFEYTSFCPLPTNFGTMEGHFHFIDNEGQKFDAEVKRFYLATNLNEFPKNQFNRGQIVTHKLYGYRGVVVDYDMTFSADDKWYQSTKSKPDKNSPWYHVLVDGSDKVTYVAQQNIDICNDIQPITHPLIKHFFTSFDSAQYIRNQNSWRDIGV